MEERWEVRVEAFASGTDPVPGLVDVFGIDAATAAAVVARVPAVVKRGAARADAEQIAAALRALGATVRVVRAGERVSTAPAAVASLRPPHHPGASPGGEPVLEVDDAPRSSTAPARIDAPGAMLDAGPGALGADALELAAAPDPRGPARLRAPIPRPSPVYVSRPPPPTATDELAAATGWAAVPVWVKALLVVAVAVGAGLLVRAGIPRPTASATSPSGAPSYEAREFASRSHTGFANPDTDRVIGLVSTLYRVGATRVTVDDVVPLLGRHVARQLVVELPPDENARRAIVHEVLLYESHDRPELVGPAQAPPASQHTLRIELGI